MLSLLPVARVITIVAVVYAVLILTAVATLLTINADLSVWETITMAGSGATALQLLLAFGLTSGWKQLWSWFPALNDLIFPAVDGDWKMVIDWKSKENGGTVEATATFKQTFLSLSMEVYSAGSESETLVATPKRQSESGRPMLFYVYRVTPKNSENDAGHPYEGSAVLKFAGRNKLSGNYFTSQSTTGRFSLTRIEHGLVAATKDTSS